MPPDVANTADGCCCRRLLQCVSGLVSEVRIPWLCFYTVLFLLLENAHDEASFISLTYWFEYVLSEQISLVSIMHSHLEDVNGDRNASEARSTKPGSLDLFLSDP